MDSALLISTQPEVDQLCQELKSADKIAFDTEFVPEFTFTPQLCLIQIAANGIAAAVDVQEPLDLYELWVLLTDPARELVVHAGKEELNFCRQYAGRLPTRFIDVQIAAGLVGYGYPLSLDALLQKTTTSGRLNKAETRTDWRRRPLSPQQIHYALDDVRYLLEARRVLGEKLKRFNREAWLDEEIQRFIHSFERQADERWQRVPGAGAMRGREMAVFRELVQWRDDRARRLDRPARWVLRDDLLAEIAKRQPRTARDLQQLRGVGGLQQSDLASDVLAAVGRGVSMPASEWPKRSAKKDLDDDQMVVKILSAALIHLAQSNSIAPSLFGGNDDLREFVHFLISRHGETSEAYTGGDTPKLGQGWRAAVCGPYFKALLEGKVHLRIAANDGKLSLVFEDHLPTL